MILYFGLFADFAFSVLESDQNIKNATLKSRIKHGIKETPLPSNFRGSDSNGVFDWQGWQDLNLRIPESKSGALPLGDIPLF